ncbi:insertion element iso-iS1d protein insA [Chryseobacterium aquaticum]|uniref:Insertion element iso-iS1d protein insA n=1 Tax=Chryseobacterium aquaticum TaxID=452084 RepID=A0A0Q3HNK5_9FLAO|nr:insertion element iso-iS1d protein insA [Chryseobacterium aquaticum]
MDCPKCKSNRQVKDGNTNGRQRYQCKNCGYRFSVERRSTEKSDEKKRLALQLYLEGLGFRAIGRVLEINFMTVYYWIKKWGDSVSLPSSESPVEIVELDELHSYVKNKKTTAGSGLLLIDLEKGSSILFVGKEIQ